MAILRPGRAQTPKGSVRGQKRRKRREKEEREGERKNGFPFVPCACLEGPSREHQGVQLFFKVFP